MPIFRVKSVKIYTGQKNLHWRHQWRQWQLWGMHSATWCEHCPTEHWQIKQICTFCHRHHTHQNNSDGFWDQQPRQCFFRQQETPDCSPQILQARHQVVDVCEKHLKPEHLLFVLHLVVQKRAGVCHPIFSSCSIPVQLRGRALVHT